MLRHVRIRICLLLQLLYFACAAPTTIGRPALGGCTRTEECRTCSATEKEEYSECRETGRWEMFRCPVVKEEDGEEGFQMVYLSCKRTKAEDEFLLVRLQAICLLMGTIAFLSARKQKTVSLTSFDRRKMHGDAVLASRQNGGALEMASREETAPLTSESDSLSVV